MHKRITCLGATFSSNMGSSAMLTGFINAIRSREPNIEIDVITIFPSEDAPEAERLDVTLVDGRISLLKLTSRFFRVIGRALGGRLLGISSDPFIRSVENANLVVDLSGDGFTEDYGTFEVLASVADILLVKLLHKKIVIYAQSIGPFHNFITKKLARLALNKVDLLMVREEITKKNLCDLGVKGKIHLVGDAALLMEPAPKERAKEILLKEGLGDTGKPSVGLSISQHIFQTMEGKEESYVHTMASLVDHLTHDLGVNVVLIPHVLAKGRGIDDYQVSEIVMRHLANPSGVYLIRGEYRADELKAVISTMSMFIGARMHANIAALSTYVPVLAISYSHKTEGIMSLLGQEEWVLPADNMGCENLQKKVDSLWSCRDEVRNSLLKGSPGVNALAWQGIELTLVLLNLSNHLDRM